MAASATTTLPDYYEVLEVSSRARPSVIKAAYGVLMKEYHPDVQGPGKTARIPRAIIEAHAVVGDAAKRAAYDQSRQRLEGTVIGEYRVLEEIAEGGFGKTYRGEHMIVGSPVCIKHCSRVSPQDTELLIKEARAAWDLRHFSIPAMRNMLRLEDGSVVLVMSFIPGPTLEQIVKKTGRVDAEHVAWITERILNALFYMHHHGVIHGDVKPQNVIIQPESHTVVIVDFGLSMVKPKASDVAVGFTPLFASPEQERGLRLGPASDLCSLGMTMLFALSGDYGAVRRKEVPADTPDVFCEFLRRLIVRDPASRPTWKDENLCQTIERVRIEAFGRRRTGMAPIPGV